MLIHPEKHLGSFLFLLFCNHRLPIWISDKESVCLAGDMGSIPGPGRPLRKEMETHPSILAWEIPWTEESGRLQSMGSQKSQTGLRDYTTATTPGWGSSLWVFYNAFPWVLGEPLNQGFHFSVLKKFLNSFSHIFFPFTFSLSFFHWNISWSNHLDFFLTWIVYSFYFCFS